METENKSYVSEYIVCQLAASIIKTINKGDGERDA